MYEYRFIFSVMTILLAAKMKLAMHSVNVQYDLHKKGIGIGHPLSHRMFN